MQSDYVTTAAQDLELFIRLNKKYKLASLYINKLQCQLGINGISYSKTFLRAYLIDWCKIFIRYKVLVGVPFTVLIRVLFRAL